MVLLGVQSRRVLVCDVTTSETDVVTLQVNFSWKITFDTLYTNEFVIRVYSRALSIPSERNTI